MPTYTYSQITPQLITNFFLYGSSSKPSNLVNDALIRPADEQGAYQTTITVSMESVMGTGHGRFAYGANSDLVSEFFDNSHF